MSTYDICPRHNYQMTGIGTLLFCPKCDAEGVPTPAHGDQNYYYVVYNHLSKSGELALYEGHLFFDSEHTLRDTVRPSLVKLVYKVPRDSVSGYLNETRKDQVWTLKTALIGVPGELAENK